MPLDCGATTSTLLDCNGGRTTARAPPASAPSTTKAPKTTLGRRTARSSILRSTTSPQLVSGQAPPTAHPRLAYERPSGAPDTPTQAKPSQTSAGHATSQAAVATGQASDHPGLSSDRTPGACRGTRCAHRCQPITDAPGKACTGSGGACMKRL